MHPPPAFHLQLTDLALPAQDWPALQAGSMAGGTPHQVLSGPLAAVQAAAARSAQGAAGPLTVFAPLPDAATLLKLDAAGLSGWWPLDRGAPAELLQACLQTDQIRWALAQHQREQLRATREQLDAQRWVDRAKGVLMQARGLCADEALQLLQGAAASAGLPVGAVARAVTEAAQWAEAVNRAGRLRMQSQRLIKLAAQALAGVDARQARETQAMAQRQVEATLDMLQDLPVLRDSDPSVGKALAAVQQAWQALHALLQTPARLSLPMLQQADGLADSLLAQAEALTGALEAGGARRALRLVNLCGRQRMRVQRLAKEALLAQLLSQPARLAALPALQEDFEATLRELERAPLGSPAARETLDGAREQWLNLLRGLRGAHSPEGRHALAVASDALLLLFDRLTDDYEHSLQLILS